MDQVSIFWLRRDLRLEDNVGLAKAAESGLPVLPLFIFDEHILKHLPADDARLSFIHQSLESMHLHLRKHGAGIATHYGKPLEVWERLLATYQIAEVHTNRDYEPYALERDQKIAELLQAHNITLCVHKDQVIFEENDVLKDDGKPYTVYTPFKNKWLSKYTPDFIKAAPTLKPNQFYSGPITFHSLEEIGFKTSEIQVKPYALSELGDYSTTRDFPATDGTSYLSPHLRFGTVGVRQVLRTIPDIHSVFASELIWREFFMQILYHFPHVQKQSFKQKYDQIKWRNNEKEFKLWCSGQTGYPLVDAGMRQLNQTGYMHNRVRMVVASFLCKHLMIDWRWGEAYFAEKLLDFDLSANNGNWQWAAGTGCDAAPYFRVFNPHTQLEKFDKKLLYVRKWVKDFDSLSYPQPMVEHKMARERALATYKQGLETG